MSYKEALEAAGAVVHRFFETGSYQGDWYAFVWFEGQLGWAQGNYGSCSGCDAFENEFDGAYQQNDNETEAEYNARLAKFGRSYLDTIVGHEELIASLRKKDYRWDEDEEAIEKMNAIGREFGFEEKQ